MTSERSGFVLVLHDKARSKKSFVRWGGLGVPWNVDEEALAFVTSEASQIRALQKAWFEALKEQWPWLKESLLPKKPSDFVGHIEWTGPLPEWVVVGAEVREVGSEEWTIAAIDPEKVLLVDDESLQPTHWLLPDFLSSWGPVITTRFERELF